VFIGYRRNKDLYRLNDSRTQVSNRIIQSVEVFVPPVTDVHFNPDEKEKNWDGKGNNLRGSEIFEHSVVDLTSF
jgi:hypothetical protein